MTIYWPGVIVCLVATTAGLACWWWLLPKKPADTPSEAPVTEPTILLRHNGDLYPVDDLWDAITVSRILARLDQEHDAA